MTDNTMNRRRFLEIAGVGSAALAASMLPGDAEAAAKKPEERTLSNAFNGTKLIDQYSKEFNVPELFKDKPCIILFGYGGCANCQKISEAVVATQEKLLRNGKNVPIILISVNPEEDKKDLKTYLASYYEKGVKQLAKEHLPKGEDNEAKRREIGEKSFDENKDVPQSERIFHIACPRSGEEAKGIEDRLGLILRSGIKNHSLRMTLCDRGKVQTGILALPNNHEEPGKAAEISKWIDVKTTELTNAARKISQDR